MKRFGPDPRECGFVQPLLYDAASGRLEADDSQRVQAHLKHCAACRGESVRLRQVLLLAKAEVGPAPAWLSARTIARIRAQDRHERERATVPIWRRLLPQVAVSGALAAAGLIAFVLLRPQIAEASRWATVQSAKRAASMAPAFKGAQGAATAGKKFVLAFGKAVEVTLGF